MNIAPKSETLFSACPHDCPSTCALEVERVDGQTIGRVKGAADNTYTDGVVCAKVARYAERIHHPDRLLQPMRRVGAKGSADFAPVSWDDALDIVAENLLSAEQRHGSETVWPYYYAGTMGLVMRDGINRLRHAKKYSGQFSTICVNPAWTGFAAGTGRLAGPDPREIAKSDLVVIWGTNPVNTQINLMTHAIKARKENGAKIVVVDVYQTGTMKQADLALRLRPGTDGALAVAVMHVLFRDGYANRDYMAQYADCPDDLEIHLKTRTPEWASEITGLSVELIETFARMIGTTPKTYLRLGYGFTRSRNGAFNMHAAMSIATVTGAWLHEGGGAFHTNGAIFHWNKTMIEGLDMVDPSVRLLDQSRIGPALTGDPHDLRDGPPVTALFVQNTNPVTIAPEQNKVKEGFAREDLFVCVHEQFMTETARCADVVLPATMFLEHDDVYQGGGHQHIILGPKIVDAPGECRSNHEVLAGLAQRLGVEHAGFNMSERELIDWTLQQSGWGTIEELEEKHWIDCQPDFDRAHYVDGFAYPDGKFRFRPDWINVKAANDGPMGPHTEIPSLPDYWNITENADEEHPYRLVTAPSRSFLNTTFNETPGSIKKEGRPELMISFDDAARIGLSDGDRIAIGNERGRTVLHARVCEDVNPGVVISEGIWPNDAFEGGHGINVLTSADQLAPYGGAAFHDNHIWIEPL